MDINVFSKNSSDPYYILHARHADGTLHEVARSEVVPKNLSPQWLGLEVPFEKLRGATQLKVEVMDKDMGKKDDLIGTCTFDLLPVANCPRLEKINCRNEKTVRANSEAGSNCRR